MTGRVLHREISGGQCRANVTADLGITSNHKDTAYRHAPWRSNLKSVAGIRERLSVGGALLHRRQRQRLLEERQRLVVVGAQQAAHAEVVQTEQLPVLVAAISSNLGQPFWAGIGEDKEKKWRQISQALELVVRELVSSSSKPV